MKKYWKQVFIQVWSLQKKKNHVCLTQQERTGILTKSKKGDSWKVGTKFSRT